MRLFDVLGPVMTGPSSSHTAGAVRIVLTARRLLGSRPLNAEIQLHGSFAATGRGHGTDTALVEKCEDARKKFKAAMDDDLNTPDALAAIFDLVKDINTLSDASDKATLETAAKTFDELTGVLGLLYNRKKTDSIPAEVTALVEERAAAKKAKDWGRADTIRAQLTEMGWSVTDTAQGPKLAKL